MNRSVNNYVANTGGRAIVFGSGGTAGIPSRAVDPKLVEDAAGATRVPLTKADVGPAAP